MKVLILGGTGMLGHKLVQNLSPELEVWTTVRDQFESVKNLGVFDSLRTIENVDAMKPESVRAAIAKVRPDVVINAIGVIKQLPTAKDVITTLTVNSIFPQQLAQMSAEYNFRLIAISTDCVFSGSRGNYVETDAADALDLYGRSKFFGEVTGDRCLTLRTSIIGREIGTAHSLVEWFLENRDATVNGYVNAIYSGFPTIVLTDIISDLILRHQDLAGLYHVASAPINKYELLQLLNEAYGAGVEIIKFDDFRIDRSLDSSEFFRETGYEVPTWPDMIKRMAGDPTPYDQWRKTQH